MNRGILHTRPSLPTHTHHAHALDVVGSVRRCFHLQHACPCSMHVHALGPQGPPWPNAYVIILRCQRGGGPQGEDGQGHGARGSGKRCAAGGWLLRSQRYALEQGQPCLLRPCHYPPSSPSSDFCPSPVRCVSASFSASVLPCSRLSTSGHASHPGPPSARASRSPSPSPSPAVPPWSLRGGICAASAI